MVKKMGFTVIINVYPKFKDLHAFYCSKYRLSSTLTSFLIVQMFIYLYEYNSKLDVLFSIIMCIQNCNNNDDVSVGSPGVWLGGGWYMWSRGCGSTGTSTCAGLQLVHSTQTNHPSPWYSTLLYIYQFIV